MVGRLVNAVETMDAAGGDRPDKISHLRPRFGGGSDGRFEVSPSGELAELSPVTQS